MRRHPTKLLATLVALSVFLATMGSSVAMAMNKAELTDAIASSSGISKADAKRALDGFINATSGALKKGDRVALVGFGSFTVSKRRNSNPNGGAHHRDDRTVKFFAGDVPVRPNETVVDNSGLAAAMAADMCADPAAKDSGVADQTCLDTYQKVSSQFLESFGPAVIDGLQQDGIVEIDGFGEFSLPGHAGALREGNPQHGKEIKIAAKKVVKFKAGAELSKKVN